MPRVYRLTNEKHTRDPNDLVTGEGARLYGGRWNHKGTAIVYAASHVSLAVLEALVHGETLPKNMVLVAYDVPDVPIPGVRMIAELPPDWAAYPFSKATQDIGTMWARRRAELALRVPSAVVPHEMNWLVNPHHAGIAKVKVTVLGAFSFDGRLRR
ncbi:MAG TPA: RES family NAD+ phosphorylase [Polyangiaceae bacterium]|nr:RES family NAD+ phosphorylase [Polyangiaceae bacterium]